MSDRESVCDAPTVKQILMEFQVHTNACTKYVNVIKWLRMDKEIF